MNDDATLFCGCLKFNIHLVLLNTLYLQKLLIISYIIEALMKYSFLLDCLIFLKMEKRKMLIEINFSAKIIFDKNIFIYFYI